jgi:hypothetical protein
MGRKAKFGQGPVARKRGNLLPRKRFKIVCEGRVTEQIYISALARKHGANVVLLKTVGTPATIAQAIIQEKKLDKSAARRESWGVGTEYWAVFDRDEHPFVPEAISELGNHSIGCAFSNPCFELWLILHYKDFDRPEHRHRVQKELETLDEEYIRKAGKAPDVLTLIEQVEQAERRAQAMDARREAEGAAAGNPSTAMWKLAEAIRKGT